MSTSITSDRDIEFLCDVRSKVGVSNCCGASVIDYQDNNFLCTDCKEYCDVVTVEEKYD